MQACALEMLNM